MPSSGCADRPRGISSRRARTKTGSTSSDTNRTRRCEAIPIACCSGHVFADLGLKNRWRERRTRHRIWRCLLIAGIIVGEAGASGAGPGGFRATLGPTPMITTNVLSRVFHIRWGDSTGTAFAIDHASKQYLVTARHVVKEIDSGDSIRVFHEEQWKNLTVNVVGIGDGDADIAVLSCSIRISPSLDLVASQANLTYGQQVFFLGFPYQMDSGGEKINRGLPLPFVKSGIVSAFEFGDVSKIYLDAHVNPGFSGGPVVFTPIDGSATDLRVAGIVASHPAPLQPVVDQSGNTITDPEGKPAGLYVRENPGIVVAIGIRHVIELIEANPIGFPLGD